MATKLILRLETPEGKGIYTSEVAQEICHEIGDDYYAYDLSGPHPMPTQDSLLVKNSFNSNKFENHNYGFYGYSQFRAWFFSDRFLEATIDYDIELSVYSVPSEYVILGNSQCVFDRAHATKVASFAPNISREDFDARV